MSKRKMGKKRGDRGRQCDGTFLVPEDILINSFECPDCAARWNSDGRDVGLGQIIQELRSLAADGRLMLWDPDSRTIVSGADAGSICANGRCLQIGLPQQRHDEPSPAEEAPGCSCYLCNVDDPNEVHYDPDTHGICLLHAAMLWELAKAGLTFDVRGSTVEVALKA